MVSETDEQIRAQAAHWMISFAAERPHLRALLERFPPDCEVMALRELKCPRGDARATVVSYTINGDVGVIQEGNNVEGYCHPDWLKPIAFVHGMTPDWVRSVFAKASEREPSNGTGNGVS